MSRHVIAAVFAAALLAGAPASSVAQELRLDPQQVEGPAACGECHKKSLAAWKKAHHATTFKDMPRSDKAREIADKMGIKRVKNESDCLSCHFTSAAVEGKVEPVAGITCESCHSASKEWIDVHSDFGGEDVTAKTEVPEHRKTRWMKAEAAGMIRPGNLYALAANCFQCHTVPNEKLVNVGGHEAGSDFELVAWSQGEVRHNTWYNDGKENAEAALERRRQLYVVGRALDLEYALRGVAKATTKDAYAVAMVQRAKRAAQAIKAIADAGAKLPEIEEMLKIAGGAEIKLGNEAALKAAAERVAEQARKLAQRPGTDLAAVDGLLPKPDAYKGTVFKP